jgi:hypothetical protein
MWRRSRQTRESSLSLESHVVGLDRPDPIRVEAPGGAVVPERKPGTAPGPKGGEASRARSLGTRSEQRGYEVAGHEVVEQDLAEPPCDVGRGTERVHPQGSDRVVTTEAGEIENRRVEPGDPLPSEVAIPNQTGDVGREPAFDQIFAALIISVPTQRTLRRGSTRTLKM